MACPVNICCFWLNYVYLLHVLLVCSYEFDLIYWTTTSAKPPHTLTEKHQSIRVSEASCIQSEHIFKSIKVSTEIKAAEES